LGLDEPPEDLDGVLPPDELLREGGEYEGRLSDGVLELRVRVSVPGKSVVPVNMSRVVRDELSKVVVLLYGFT